MSTNNRDQDEVSAGRRELLKAVAAASGVVATRVLLPVAWSTPIVASMALPAHAALSSASSQPQNSPAGSTTTPGSGANGVAIVPTVSGETVTLTITPPASVITARTQFQVCERFDDTKATPTAKFVRVVSLMTPSGDATLSGSFKLELTRPKGDYEYQLRWSDGNTAWVQVTVNAS
jgi:hypothetical protein